MSKVKLLAARRLMIVRSTQTYKNIGDEWIVDPDQSDLSCSELANRFFKQNHVVPVFVSPPAFQLISRTENPPRIVVATSVSILYEPAETVVDESQIESAETHASQFESIPLRIFGIREPVRMREVQDGFRIASDMADPRAL